MIESTIDNFLSFREIADKVDRGETLNPIDQLLYDHTPAGNSDEQEFRKQVFALVGFAASNAVSSDVGDRSTVKEIAQDIANMQGMPYCWEDIQQRLESGMALRFKLNDR